MNWQLGLRRLSRVVWGIAAAILALFFGFMTKEQPIAAVICIGIFVALGFGMHRATCWIIDGFFAPK